MKVVCKQIEMFIACQFCEKYMYRVINNSCYLVDASESH